MFSLEWKPEVNFIVSNGAFYMVKSLNKPYICKPEENTQFGLTKPIVLPYINDDDIFKDGDKQYILEGNTWKKIVWKDNLSFYGANVWEYRDSYCVSDMGTYMFTE